MRGFHINNWPLPRLATCSRLYSTFPLLLPLLSEYRSLLRRKGIIFAKPCIAKSRLQGNMQRKPTRRHNIILRYGIIRLYGKTSLELLIFLAASVYAARYITFLTLVLNYSLYSNRNFHIIWPILQLYGNRIFISALEISFILAKYKSKKDLLYYCSHGKAAVRK
jgi:hypothetical protein